MNEEHVQAVCRQILEEVSKINQYFKLIFRFTGIRNISIILLSIDEMYETLIAMLLSFNLCRLRKCTALIRVLPRHDQKFLTMYLRVVAQEAEG